MGRGRVGEEDKRGDVDYLTYLSMKYTFGGGGGDGWMGGWVGMERET